MQVIYANQPAPETWTSAIFLAGPTPRSAEVPSWRPEALRLLEAAGYDGVVFVPEDEGGEWRHSYLAQVEWESTGLNFADVIVFWVPRQLDTMPAFTTNVEFGHWVGSGKVVLGYPPGAPKNRYLDWLLEHHARGRRPEETLEATLDAALARIGDASAGGAPRTGGERHVPLDIWRTPSFRAWYDSLTRAGHRLDGARQRWAFRSRKGGGQVFAWVLQVEVWIPSEGRHKTNEWVFARSDIAAVALWRAPERTGGLAGLLETELVLVREFRAPARTPDGFVHELPGGSSTETGDPLVVASEELREETGLTVAPERLKPLGSRQLAGTLSSHHGHLFAAELTAGEMARARAVAAAGTVHGAPDSSERTTVEVTTFGAMLREGLCDWTTLGMVAAALLTP